MTLKRMRVERDWLADHMPGRPCDNGHECPFVERRDPDCRERISSKECWLEQAWQQAGCMAEGRSDD